MSFWHHAKILQKLMIQFQKTPRQTEGLIEGQMGGQKAGQILFYRTLAATTLGPITKELLLWKFRCKIQEV